MKPSSRILLAGLWALALGGCAGPGPAQSGLPKEVLLRLKGKPGDTYTLVTTLETEAEFSGPGGVTEKARMTLVSTEEHTCESVEGGKQSWRAKCVKAEGSGTGQLEAEAERAKKQQLSKDSKQTKDDRNRILDVGSEESLALTFPESAVKPGSAWSGETTMMGAPVQIDFKLDRFERVGSRVAAVISATVTGGDKVKTTEPVMIFVDVATGWPIRGIAAFKMNPMPNVVSTMKVRMEAR